MPSAASSSDQSEPYLGSTFSRAKYAEARSRISISIACTWFSRRSRTNSARTSLRSPSLRPSSTSDRYAADTTR